MDEFSQRDIEFHEQKAASYDRDITSVYDVYHRFLLEPFIDRLRVELPPPRRALDLGCGTGVVSLALARRDFSVVGVDHSQDMLEIAERKAAGEGLAESCRFMTGDVRDVPFGDGAFDVVTCQGLLHHLEDPEPCLRELKRVLRPGGAFFLSDPTSGETPVKRALVRVWRLARRKTRDEEPEGPETVEEPIDVDRLRATLETLGLEFEARFLTHLPPARRLLPDRLYLAVARAVSFPWRSRQGDLVFVFGRKP